MKLIFLSDGEDGNQYEIDKEVTIGRDISNHIVLSDPSVSLVHCQIRFDDSRVFIRDLGSTNGTYVNGKRVINSELFDKDCLLIGIDRIRVEMASEIYEPTVSTVAEMHLDETSMEDRYNKKDESDLKELSGNIFGEVTYFLKRKIADGGMGAVYEAEQFGAEGFIKKVAIKIILPTFARKDSFVSSFIGEAKLVANLIHQNIVQIHHLGRHNGGYYIAMEYIDGINLTDFMTCHKVMKRNVPIDIASFIISRICRGLEYAHNKKDESGRSLGLVHRDVSPNNIMITREGEVKLTDFGVAKAAQFMEDDDEYLVGSIEYMSPEQANCSEVDGRSDLFSLSLVYYELLTGIRLFQCKDGNIEDTLDRVKATKIIDPKDLRPDLPDSVANILKKCLEKEPDKRYQSSNEFGSALEHEMYSHGYGPTIIALAGYMEKTVAL